MKASHILFFFSYLIKKGKLVKRKNRQLKWSCFVKSITPLIHPSGLQADLGAQNEIWISCKTYVLLVTKMYQSPTRKPKIGI